MGMSQTNQDESSRLGEGPLATLLPRPNERKELWLAKRGKRKDSGISH